MPTYAGAAAIKIQAPVETVYAYLDDFTHHPEWVKNVSKVEQLSPGPARVGTVFKTSGGPPPVAPGRKAAMMAQFLFGVLGGAKSYSEARITALEPPRRIAWRAGIPKGEGFFNLAEWGFLLEPRGSATALTQRFCWQPQNPTAERMVRAAGVDGLQQAVAVSLAELKRRLEK
jgi:uncharacterized protein YndB with AHSA1/START domain